MKVVCIPQPFVVSFTCMQDLARNQVRERGWIEVDLHMEGKSRISVSINDPGKTAHKVDIIPAGSEKFKFHAKPHMFSGNRSILQQFKLTTHQGWPELQQHLKNVMCEVFMLTPDSNFEIRVYKNKAYYTARSYKDDPQPETTGLFAQVN
jgi:hypothetical protein